MTERIFLDHPGQTSVAAIVVASGPAGVVLDRTVFYARSGGQPGDTGALLWEGGAMAVADTIKGEGEAILHVPADGASIPVAGTRVTANLDRDRRLRLMRMHTSLHLLCAVLPGAGVTGGQIGTDRSRLDFDLPAAPAKETIEAALNALIEADHPVSAEWVDEAMLDSDPGLVRTLSVEAAARSRADPPGPHRGGRAAGRSAALRRHACRAHRRDRPGAGAEDRKQGQAEPAHRHCPGQLRERRAWTLW